MNTFVDICHVSFTRETNQVIVVYIIRYILVSIYIQVRLRMRTHFHVNISFGGLSEWPGGLEPTATQYSVRYECQCHGRKLPVTSDKRDFFWYISKKRENEKHVVFIINCYLIKIILEGQINIITNQFNLTMVLVLFVCLFFKLTSVSAFRYRVIKVIVRYYEM